MTNDIEQLRVEYDGAGFHADAAGADPMSLFAAWFEEASSSSVVEPNAMSIATVAVDGTPSSRMVLLKHVDEQRGGFVFYTNLESRKGREALASGVAAACWWWPGSPGRQVRAVGRIEQLERSDSERYFASRPEAARIGAIASRQSCPVLDRATIDARAAAIDPARASLPARWGGLRLVADEIEFWQGRAGRLHDRISFLRLAPDESIRSKAALTASGGEASLLTAGTVVHDRHGDSWLRVRLEP